MAKKALTIVTKETSSPKTRKAAPRFWRERPFTEDELFEGTNEVGASGWFLRLNISGLYPRRIGPFSSREDALELMEKFLCEVVVGPICDEVQNANYDHVVEGIPQLVASTQYQA